jgi:phospholipid/cholesterol/gamma-HCH transport system ATP-binding protein
MNPSAARFDQEEFDIELVDVTKSFRNGRDKVLRGVNLRFPRGKLTYILGSSGAGKSVMLKHILGLLSPDSGTVKVLGKDLSKLSPRELVDHRTHFGMLFQNSALFDDFSVFENVAFPLREHSRMSEDEIRTRVESALQSLGMKSGYDKLPNELSGGMRKRVGLARAIIREPRVLLYDEPTTGLDPVTRLTVDDLIAQLKSSYGLTSVVISHDIPSALHLADRIAFLHQGEILFWGTPAEFRKAPEGPVKDFLRAEERTLATLQGERRV